MCDGDPKAENLIFSYWYGKESSECDGGISGYSNLSQILVKKQKKSIGKTPDFFQIVTNNFKFNTKVDYFFQYKYRSKSISYIFKKELFFAFVMLLFFQYINYQYLELLAGPKKYLDVVEVPEFGRNVTIVNTAWLPSMAFDYSSNVFVPEETDEAQLR
mmetsp:Transcript_13067/g.12918  ORF Transcript_13067/g.12918 Transcript_13067/m.12918 type:complete len:159 (-) Transcript_13067:31-507(-)